MPTLLCRLAFFALQCSFFQLLLPLFVRKSKFVLKTFFQLTPLLAINSSVRSLYLVSFLDWRRAGPSQGTPHPARSG
jgi:hypothetical protein